MALGMKHSLQFPDQFGMGNDYLQDETYVVAVDEKTGKSTYRDGIFTKLAQDVKDPDGFNKRTVVTPQSAWKKDVEDNYPEFASALSGETDSIEVFSDLYATGSAFGYPFVEKTDESYYKDDVADGLPTGVDVADFRPTQNIAEHE